MKRVRAHLPGCTADWKSAIHNADKMSALHFGAQASSLHYGSQASCLLDEDHTKNVETPA